MANGRRLQRECNIHNINDQEAKAAQEALTEIALELGIKKTGIDKLCEEDKRIRQINVDLLTEITKRACAGDPAAAQLFFKLLFGGSEMT